MKRKLIAGILTVAMLLSLTACGSTTEVTETETTKTEKDAIDEKTSATGKEITASRDLIKIQQELLKIEQDKDAVDEDALITKKFKIQAIENEIKRLDKKEVNHE